MGLYPTWRQHRPSSDCAILSGPLLPPEESLVVVEQTDKQNASASSADPDQTAPNGIA